MVEIPEPSDSEPGSPEEGGGGGRRSWTHGIGLVKSITALVVAMTALFTTLHRVGVIGGAETATAEPAAETSAATTAAGTTTEVPDPASFSDPPGLFAAIIRPNGRAYFDGDSMFVTTRRPTHPLVHLADMEEQRDVRVSVTAERLSGAPDYGVGLVCRYGASGTYYLASVLSGGRYNVMRYRGGKGRSLTNGIQPHASLEGDRHELTLRCVGGSVATLTFVVDGRPIHEAVDPEGLGPGIVGVRAGSGESVVTVRFDDFVLRNL